MEIPEKTFFKIGEVAKLLEVEAYVLRYWESEFDMLVPEKTKSGQRIYQHEDIVLLAKIRDLLYADMYTIAGARRQLELSVDNVSGEVVEHAVVDSVSPEKLAVLTTEYAALQNAYDALKIAHEDLQGLHDLHLATQVETRASIAQLELDYENVCDERDVLTAQLEVLQLENETLHLSLIPSKAAVESEEKNNELFEVIAQLESELRDAHQLSDELRETRKQQLTQEEQRRRSAMHALRVELEELARLGIDTLPG